MLTEIQERMAAACDRAGRKLTDVKLVAVTKGHSVEEIKQQVISHGHYILGENRIQAWRDKRPALPGAEWHMIGNLQRNKVKYCLPFSLIHSLNSQRLADELQRQGEKNEHIFKVLVEVNVAGEDSKQGIAPKDAEDLVYYAQNLHNIQVEGLMTLAPYSDNPESARRVFVKLHTLCDRLKLKELSMGMSGDFEVAIEEGATLIRVGSALFNP